MNDTLVALQYLDGVNRFMLSSLSSCLVSSNVDKIEKRERRNHKERRHRNKRYRALKESTEAHMYRSHTKHITHRNPTHECKCFMCVEERVSEVSRVRCSVMHSPALISGRERNGREWTGMDI